MVCNCTGADRPSIFAWKSFNIGTTFHLVLLKRRNVGSLCHTLGQERKLFWEYLGSELVLIRLWRLFGLWPAFGIRKTLELLRRRLRARWFTPTDLDFSLERAPLTSKSKAMTLQHFGTKHRFSAMLRRFLLKQLRCRGWWIFKRNQL